MMEEKKLLFQSKIDDEHGIDFHRNIDLSGYTVYRDESFISFKIIKIKEVDVAFIEYIYATSRSDFIKLVGFCMKFWQGSNVKFIYIKEHKRKQNYVQEFLSSVDFTVEESFPERPWKKPWICNNGYKENHIIETFL